jgi:hypothetical protein
MIIRRIRRTDHQNQSAIAAGSLTTSRIIKHSTNFCTQASIGINSFFPDLNSSSSKLKLQLYPFHFSVWKQGTTTTDFHSTESKLQSFFCDGTSELESGTE